MRHACAAILVVMAVAPGCARLVPAGFWTTYRPDLISGSFSDQGPWGGTRWVLWASPTAGTFTSTDILEFARAEGWECSSVGDALPDVQRMPRHLQVASDVFACKTGWIRVAPGTGETSDALGYVQIEKSGTRMAIYHLWGEL
jgi:hypothetical protein